MSAADPVDEARNRFIAAQRKRWFDEKIREHYYEPLGRKKIAESLRYLAKFANGDTCFVWLNLQADLAEGKLQTPDQSSSSISA